MLAWVCSGFALSITMLSISLWRLGLRPTVPGVRTAEPARGSWLLRWPVGPVARWLEPSIPDRWRAAGHGVLERAGLDDRLNAAQGLALLLLSAGATAVACLLLSGAAGHWLAEQVVLAAAVGLAVPCIALRDRILKLQSAVMRELPGFLDLLTLGLEAGCAFGAALQIAVQRSTASPLRASLERSLQEMRAGRPRAEALQRLERRLGVTALSAAVAAITQAEATGVSLAPVMRAQAVRATQERFARAEKRAMEAPVKMLAPLVLCIFPCTFIVIGFPIAVRLFWGA